MKESHFGEMEFSNEELIEILNVKTYVLDAIVVADGILEESGVW